MTTLFILSLVGMFLLIAFKSFEIKVRKINTLAALFAKGDSKIHSLLEKAIFAYNRSKKISKIFLFEFLPSYAYELLTRMKDYVSKRYYNAGDGFRGRRVLRSNGSVSFFLQKITDESGEVQERKA